MRSGSPPGRWMTSAAASRSASAGSAAEAASMTGTTSTSTAPDPADALRRDPLERLRRRAPRPAPAGPRAAAVGTMATRTGSPPLTLRLAPAPAGEQGTLRRRPGTPRRRAGRSDRSCRVVGRSLVRWRDVLHRWRIEPSSRQDAGHALRTCHEGREVRDEQDRQQEPDPDRTDRDGHAHAATGRSRRPRSPGRTARPAAVASPG